MAKRKKMIFSQRLKIKSERVGKRIRRVLWMPFFKRIWKRKAEKGRGKLLPHSSNS